MSLWLTAVAGQPAGLQQNGAMVLKAIEVGDCGAALKGIAAMEGQGAVQEEMLYQKGVCLYRTGKYEQAMKVLEGYFRDVGAAGKHYQQALMIYGKADKEREDAVKERAAEKAWLEEEMERYRKLKPEVDREMVAIVPGCFEMGSPPGETNRGEDERSHRVCVGAFAIGRYEVTYQAYELFAMASGRKSPNFEGWGRGRRPVINVSWRDATAYAEWLSERSGKKYRLPTEAEWEYAARAGTSGPFSFEGAITTDRANYDGGHTYLGSPKGEYRQQTLPAGSLPPNPWGLHEAHGNVWEWNCSLYDKTYGGVQTRCAKEREKGSRAVRGGSWNDWPDALRSAERGNAPPDEYSNVVGFRLAQDL